MKTKKNLFWGFCALAMFSCENESLDASSPDAINSSYNKTMSSGTSVYVSSNNSGALGIFDISSGITSPMMKSLMLPYVDADGVEYDSKRDAIYHVNRSDSKLVTLSNISKRMDGESITPSAMGPSTFTNGRGSSAYNNRVVVVDDVTPGRLVSYHANEDDITEFRYYDLGFEVWDVHVEGKDLWAIEDVTDKVAYYSDFFKAKSGALNPTAKVAIEGLVRTHGMDYDASTDTMLLSDIGSAANSTDGGLIVIHNFSQKFWAAGDGGTISMGDQIRVYGDMTYLGNPVDVAISPSKNAIFVAERAQQKFLVFEIPTSNCNCAPVYATDFAGASSVTTDF